MRNPFKTVYCEDCVSIILSHLAAEENPARFAECKKKVYRTNKHVGRNVKKEYYSCSIRTFPFCFWFKESFIERLKKKEQERWFC